MLTQNLEETVHAVIRDVLEERELEVPALAAHHHLTRDLGLRSLDLAQIVAGLELELGVDPFARLVAITSVRTLDDLVGAYRRALDGETAAPAPAADTGRERGEARKRAAERRAVRRGA